MRLTVGGREVQVYFQYGTQDLSFEFGDLANQTVEVPAITCVVREAPPQGPDGRTVPGSNTPVITQATACCGPTDNYDKVYGRWVAFRRAIDGLPRSERKALGDWYRQSCKIPRRSQKAA